MELEDLFPTKICNALRRGGIMTLKELQNSFNDIPKNFECNWIPHAGKDSYQMVEYILKVELP